MSGILSAARRSLVWYAAWMVPCAVGTVGLATIGLWLPEFDAEQAQLQRIENDADLEALCQKFGLLPGSDAFQACKSDLLALQKRYVQSADFL